MKDKKKIAFCLLFIILLLLITISLFINRDDEEDILLDEPEEILEAAERQSEEVNKKEIKEHTKIYVDTFIKYINNKEKKLILFARPSCNYCEIAEPILKNLAYKYKFEINYINTEEITEEEKEKLKEVDEFFENLGTPTLLVIEKGEIVDMVDGLTDKAHYKAFLKDNKIIR